MSESELTVVQLTTALERCKYVREWEPKGLIKRKDWAVDGFVEGYLPKDILAIEVESFRYHAARLLAKEDMYRAFANLGRPLTDEEVRRRDVWQQEQAQRAAQLTAKLETRRQRALLREGHRTLTAIRRHLHDPVSSRPQASRPEKTSPTS